MIELLQGDSKEVLKRFPENYFGSVVCDPPYGLTSIVDRFGKEDSAPAKEGTDGRFQRLSKGFMGHEWDGSGIEKDPEFWKEVLRVLKPGGHLISFGGTRTYHRIAVAIEDAGFEIRDTLMWLYGTGFPKSHDVGDGWGTALKPAWEPIILARKPIIEKSIKDNILKWGVGGINIDESRIELNGEIVPINKLEQWSGFGEKERPDYEHTQNIKGRWPANLMLDEVAGDLLGERSRFFYCPKASKKEKNRGLGNLPDKPFAVSSGANSKIRQGESEYLQNSIDTNRAQMVKNTHPTVKPVELMKYLVRLVTPRGEICLDPFLGSGSTGIACKELEIQFIGIELGEEYLQIARERINNW